MGHAEQKEEGARNDEESQALLGRKDRGDEGPSLVEDEGQRHDGPQVKGTMGVMTPIATILAPPAGLGEGRGGRS